MKAFPQKVSNEYKAEHGMDLRDYFAAKAMQALLATDNFNIPSLARDAYAMADGMMKEREL